MSKTSRTIQGELKPASRNDGKYLYEKYRKVLKLDGPPLIDEPSLSENRWEQGLIDTPLPPRDNSRTSRPRS